MKENYWISVHQELDGDSREVLNDFLSSIKLVLESKTVNEYRLLLEKLLVDNKVALKDLQYEDVREWIKIKYFHVTIGTRNNIISKLKMFFQFCVEEGIMDRILVKRYWRRRRPKPIPRYLSKTEQAQLRLVVEKMSLRDRTMVEFYLSTGCRLSEVRCLDVHDLELKTKTAWVLGKGKT